LESTRRQGRSAPPETAITVKLSAPAYARLEDLAAAEDQEAGDFARALIERELGEAVPTALDAAVLRTTNRSPEEIEAARTTVLATARPARPLPPGKTWLEVISGQWPGDESDEQIKTALDELS
jgi:hypothetical protein